MFSYSPGHPNLREIGSPRTKKYMRAYKSGRKKRSSTSIAKENVAMKKQKQTNEVRCLTNLEVSGFVAENEIKDHTQSLAVAEMQEKGREKGSGKFYLVTFTEGRRRAD